MNVRLILSKNEKREKRIYGVIPSRNNSIACRKSMLVWHHCKIITILKCSNSAPSSASKSSTDGSSLPGKGKFPASSTCRFCGVNAMMIQMFKLLRKRKFIIYPLANELQEWCMFPPKRKAGRDACIYFYKQFDYLISIPAQIDLHEHIKVTVHEKKDSLIRWATTYSM